MVEEDLVREECSGSVAQLKAPPSGVDRSKDPYATLHATPGATEVNKENDASSRATLNGEDISKFVLQRFERGRANSEFIKKSSRVVSVPPRLLVLLP